jgi:hypothetical protein
MTFPIYQPNGISYQQSGVDINERYVMEKNWTVQHDGFGLVTMQLKFTADSDKSYDITTDFKRGDAPPITNMENMTLHKAVASSNDGVCTVTADYCGIDGAADTTITQVQVSSTTSQDPIETHPNFSKIQCEKIGYNIHPLAGPAAYIFANESDPEKNPNKAHFAMVTTNGTQLTQYQFVGFLPSRNTEDPVNLKAGVKSYFKPGVTLRCLCYTNNAELAKKTILRVGWANYGAIGAINLPPPYNTLLNDYDSDLPVILPEGVKRDRTYLCTNASVEVYGGLYKVQADLMMSGIIGWDDEIYPVDATEPTSQQ